MNIINKVALTWREALYWMILGEKVQHQDMPENEYLEMDKQGVIVNQDGNIYENHPSDTLGNAWDCVVNHE